MVDALISQAHRHRGAPGDAPPDGRRRGGVLPDPVDEGGGAGGGRLVGGVGHMIGDAAVDLVAEAGEHGHGRVGDGEGDALVVERGQVGPRAAAAHDHDHVDGTARQRAHGAGHGGGRLLALHPHVHVRQPEPDAAALELLQDVVPRRAPAAGDQADPQRHEGEGQGGVAAHQAGVGEPGQQARHGRRPACPG